MEKFNGKIWVGFVINVLVALWGISDMATGGGTVGAIFITITAGGLLLTGAGMIMLAQGNPTGGILGAVGSAFFVPIGLICLIGCLQCRDRLRNEALADAPGSEETGTSTEEVSAVADAPVSPDGAAATNEAPTMMPAAASPAAPAAAPESRPAPAEAAAAPRSETVVEPADGKTAPEAPAVSESVPDGEGPAVEKPLAAFKFADHSLGFGSLAVLFSIALFAVGDLAPGLVAVIVVCVARCMMALKQRALYVCALYADRLDYASGIWASSQISVPYASIVEASVSGSKLCLVIEKHGSRTNISISFSLIPGDHRWEARAVLMDKMRELGVLREN